MLFRRRSPLGIADRVRLALWPASSWKRSVNYLAKRVLRLSGSPHAIAAGFAAGVFASFTPFIFFHFIISFLVAFLVGGNILAAALGTAVGNPLTFPAIWLSSYKVGNLMLGVEGGEVMADEISGSLASQPFDAILPLLRPLVIGGIPLGLGFGLAAYLIVLMAVKAYQRARRLRLEARRVLSDQRHTDRKTPESV